MALTRSNMLELGTKAPEFVLPDTVSGENISLFDIRSEKNRRYVPLQSLSLCGPR